jgi:hypothetical protein
VIPMDKNSVPDLTEFVLTLQGLTALARMALEHANASSEAGEEEGALPRWKEMRAEMKRLSSIMGKLCAGEGALGVLWEDLWGELLAEKDATSGLFVFRQIQDPNEGTSMSGALALDLGHDKERFLFNAWVHLVQVCVDEGAMCSDMLWKAFEGMLVSTMDVPGDKLVKRVERYN